MYAVIRTGGKQYRVAENQRLTVERLPGDPGETLKLGDVLMIAEDGSAPMVGTPSLDKAAVFAEVLAQTRGDKVVVFKKKRRKNYRRTKGHRQDLTVLRIAGISASGKAPAAKKKAAKAETPAEEPAPETAAETPAPEAQDAAPAEAPAAESPAAEAPAAEPKKAKKAAEPKPKADAEAAPKATPDSESKE